jgi:hypothetical protein
MNFGRLVISCVNVLVALCAMTLAAQGQSSETLIVGDTSGSLKGFAVQAPKQVETMYRILIRNTVGGRLSRMTETPQPVSVSMENVGIFARPSTYTGQTTPLVGTITKTTTDYTSVFILTDGMESDNLYLQLQETVASLAQTGWGIWIILMPLPFNGRYDLEQPLNPEMHLEKMVSCVHQRNAAWQVSLVRNANRTIQFRGERPLLIFAFDKNPDQGRQRVINVVRELERELRRPEVVELSPLHLREFTIARFEPKTLGVQVLDSVENGPRRVIADPEDGGPIKRLTVHLSWKRPESSVPQPFQEQWLLSRTRKTEWGELLINKATNLAASPGSLSLTIDSEIGLLESIGHLFSRGPIVRDSMLQFRISSILRNPIEGWWNDWNSETTWECPHKAFKLASLIARISTVARDRIMKEPPEERATLKLQIGPQ